MSIGPVYARGMNPLGQRETSMLQRGIRIGAGLTDFSLTIISLLREEADHTSSELVFEHTSMPRPGNLAYFHLNPGLTVSIYSFHFVMNAAIIVRFLFYYFAILQPHAVVIVMACSVYYL